jgi:hypothetical protein
MKSKKRPNRRLVLAGLSLLLLLLVISVAQAQTGGGYDLTWWTVDGGGGQVTGGGYTLTGTAGQPDTGTMSGNGYMLLSGFWGGGPEHRFPIYLPLVLRDQAP